MSIIIVSVECCEGRWGVVKEFIRGFDVDGGIGWGKVFWGVDILF